MKNFTVVPPEISNFIRKVDNLLIMSYYTYVYEKVILVLWFLHCRK